MPASPGPVRLCKRARWLVKHQMELLRSWDEFFNGQGVGIHWPALDEDISQENLLSVPTMMEQTEKLS